MLEITRPKAVHFSLFISALFLTFFQLIPARAESGFEERRELSASKLISPELLQSELYTVDDQVINDGLINHYKVHSVYGDFRASSTAAVKQLLHEIKMIAVMKKIETKDTAVDSVVKSGKNTVDAVANLVTEPEKTLEGAANGVSNLFNRATQVVGKRKTTNAEDSRVEQFIGKTKSKGDIATKYGVSVYSRNPVLQAELDRLAWADYLGGIGVGLAQSAIPGVGGLLLSTSGTARLLNEVINNTPASELWVRNKNKLVAMKIDPDLVELYLNNPSFTPALQTFMVESMTKMTGVADRQLFIKISLQAHTYEMASAFTEIAIMTAGYHQNVSPIQQLVPMGRILYAKTKTGATVILFPADHVLWTARLADVVDGFAQSKATARQIWILGDFSEKATKELQASGWQLNVRGQEKLLPIKKEKS